MGNQEVELMCEEYRKNRRALDKLIDSMPYFTRRTLVARFRENRGPEDPVLIDAVMTIPNYLEQLREAHVLGFTAGQYYHLFPQRDDGRQAMQ